MNSILESWMDDNSITEKPLRQGIAPPQVRIPRIGGSYSSVWIYLVLVTCFIIIGGMFLGKHITDN